MHRRVALPLRGHDCARFLRRREPNTQHTARLFSDKNRLSPGWHAKPVKSIAPKSTSKVSALLRTLVWVYNPPGKFAMARSQVEKTRRRLWIAVAVLPVLLIFGLWSTRGEALIPR